MAVELKRDGKWIKKQLEAFGLVAKNYYFKD
jgi:hypothetical protein